MQCRPAVVQFISVRQIFSSCVQRQYFVRSYHLALCLRDQFYISDCLLFTRRTCRMWLRHTMLTYTHCWRHSAVSAVSLVCRTDWWLLSGLNCALQMWATGWRRTDSSWTLTRQNSSGLVPVLLGSRGPPLQLGEETITATDHLRWLGVKWHITGNSSVREMWRKLQSLQTAIELDEVPVRKQVIVHL